ncbi:hypothetical protein WSM22_06550 [Cytophagales bacterium WSM2-2]|nr:hypothetical protein WSM22_06550 [Cytophagales bacterium WSM2-2]
MAFPIIDIHFHSTLKPFGQSFYPNENPKDACSEACIWRSDPPTDEDEVLENLVGFPPYRQSDFSSLMRGGVNVAVVSLYPIETGFVNPTVLSSLARYSVDLIALFGRKRVDYIKSPSFNYFKDLNDEYNYLLLLDKKIPTNGRSQYNLVDSGAALTQALPTESLNIIVSIEGAHVFCNGHDVKDPNNWSTLDADVRSVKAWKYPPFFITLNHHFNNSLASHAQSLFVKVLGKDLFDQKEAMETPYQENGKYISPRGEKVIDLLYATDNGRRIFIDIKHMAKETRKEFYQYRAAKNYNNIPIICSHSATVNFYNHSLNLDKDDIEAIYNSNGLIGIELDQRVLGYNDGEKGSRFWNWIKNIFKSSSQKDKFWSGYFWKNILVIAEQCYTMDNTQNPWRLICLGSDLDGIINPLNKYRTTNEFQNLANALLADVQDYWNNGNSKIPQNHLGIDAHDVVYQIMYANALGFIQQNYK